MHGTVGLFCTSVRRQLAEEEFASHVFLAEFVKTTDRSLSEFVGTGISASTITGATAFGLAYFVGAEVGHFASFQNLCQVVVALWPPAGLFLAVLTLSPYRSWFPLIVAGWVASMLSDVLLHHKSLPLSMGLCVASTFEACLGAWLLRRFVGTPFTLTQIRQVISLACYSAVLSCVAGATCGAGVITAVDGMSYWSAWQIWWTGHLLGVLTVAPVVFTWVARPTTPSENLRPRRIIENSIHFIGVIMVTEGVYGEWLPRLLRIPIFILPFLLWASMRLGPQSAGRAVLAVALIGLWNVTQGRGPFFTSSVSVNDQIFRAQGSLAIISLCVHLLAATVAERNQAEQDRIASLAELQRALAEIKTLQGLIPICAWCKSIRDDRDFWHSVEDYISEHTEARFSHGICPECLAKTLD